MDTDYNYRRAPEAKDPIYSSAGPSYFAIFRIGKKFTNIGMIDAFQKHMQREITIDNANSNVHNEVLIGDEHIKKNVENYINGIKLRSNAIVSRELLLTASPNFFRNLAPEQLQRWKDLNMEWLNKNFGSNCVYAVLHKDETTWHIHALIVPKFFDKLKGANVLSNARYFDGIDKLRSWQDNYSDYMRTVFKSLNRGVRFSKAKHIEIRHFYSLVNSQLNDNDISQLCAKAKNSELLEVKIKSLQKTLTAYRDINGKTVQEIEKMRNSIKELKKDTETYKSVIETLSENYKIPQSAIKSVVDSVQKWTGDMVLDRKR